MLINSVRKGGLFNLLNEVIMSLMCMLGSRLAWHKLVNYMFPIVSVCMFYVFLFRSGTEENLMSCNNFLKTYTQLGKIKKREKENKKQKEQEEHQKALAMRSAALSGLASKLFSYIVM